MMLTQLNTLKARLGLESFSLDDDDLLTRLIKTASGRFAKECNRQFDRLVGATFEFQGDKTEIILDRTPVESISAFHLKSNETDGWVQQSSVDYLLRNAAIVSLGSGPLGTALDAGRITFTGGYVLPGTTPAAGQTALPDELEQGCIDQCVYWYQNRNRLGLASVSGDGGSVQQMPMSVVKPLDLLPHVRNLLERYERWNP